MRFRAWPAWLLPALLLSPLARAEERIVTLAPHLAELSCAVGACAALVGVAEYTDVPAAAELPRVGGNTINLEAVLALRPTRVLAWDGGTPVMAIERLRSLGLRVDAIRVRDLDEIGAALETVGERLGHAREGREAAQAYRQRLAGLRAQYRGRSRLRAFYQIDTGPVYTVNGQSPISAALSLCGADNVFAALPTISAVVGAEAVVAANPDVVVYTSFEDPQGLAAYWSRLRPARAADPRRQVRVEANQLTRQSPRVLDGIAALCEGLDRVRRDAR